MRLEAGGCYSTGAPRRFALASLARPAVRVRPIPYGDFQHKEGAVQQRYTEMRVWKLAHRLVLRIYELTRQLPGDERYGLTSQIRRAAVSVELNIVEGSRRGTDAEFARFLDMSLASLAETEAVVLICKDLNYISAEVAASLFNDINSLTGMLMNLKKACRHQSSRSEATQS